MRKALVILHSMILLLCYIGCGSQKFEFSGVEKIELRCGDCGTAVEIVEPDEIAEITDQLNTISFEKGEANDSTGWRYWLKWYDADGNLMDEILVMSEDVIDNNSYFYRAAEGAEPIDTAYLAELLFREYQLCDYQ